MRTSGLAAAALAAALVGATQARADTLLSEGFDDIGTLAAAGWISFNASSPSGLPWFQGNAGIFGAAQGTVGSYIAANFNSSSSTNGAVDNWLITPELQLGPGATLSFYTRAAEADFQDQLEVRFSSGSGTDLSGFTTYLTSLGNPAIATYPAGDWLQVTLTLPDAVSGRIAFRYLVPDAMNASYIGIDSVVVSTVPEPTSALMLALGLTTMGFAQRRRQHPQHGDR